MTQTPETKKSESMWKVRVAGLMITALSMIGMVSAGAFNTSISDLIYGVVALIPSLVNLIIAVAPLAIIGALVTALVAFVGKALKIF